MRQRQGKKRKTGQRQKSRLGPVCPFNRLCFVRSFTFNLDFFDRASFSSFSSLSNEMKDKIEQDEATQGKTNKTRQVETR
jgi:hypothetical protein